MYLQGIVHLIQEVKQSCQICILIQFLGLLDQIFKFIFTFIDQKIPANSPCKLFSRFKTFPWDNHLTSVPSNSYVDPAFISNHSLLKMVEFKALDLIKFTA
jgi:hypothetical protein